MQQLKKEEIDRNNTFIYLHNTRPSRLGLNMPVEIYPTDKTIQTIIIKTIQIIIMDMDHQNIMK